MKAYDSVVLVYPQACATITVWNNRCHRQRHQWKDPREAGNRASGLALPLSSWVTPSGLTLSLSLLIDTMSRLHLSKQDNAGLSTCYHVVYMLLSTCYLATMTGHGLGREELAGMSRTPGFICVYTHMYLNILVAFSNVFPSLLFPPLWGIFSVPGISAAWC